MKKLFLFTVAALLSSCSVDRVEELVPAGDRDVFTATVLEWFDAEGVEVKRVVTKEGLFSRKRGTATVVIANATMDALDFKLLPETYYIRPANEEEIVERLHGEGHKVAALAAENFDLSGCTGIVVEFVKYNTAGTVQYSYPGRYPVPSGTLE